MPDQVFQEIPDQVLQTLRYLREKDDGLIRDDVHMTSALRGREGVDQFLTKEREVVWIWY